MSVGGPRYSFFITISGHIYDGVPQKIFSLVSGAVQQQKPKSINLILPFLSIMMFSNLTSLTQLKSINDLPMGDVLGVKVRENIKQLPDDTLNFILW
jgi:hypothetical protein